MWKILQVSMQNTNILLQNELHDGTNCTASETLETLHY